MLANIRIATKLYGGFTLVIAIFAALAAYQMNSISSLNELQQEVFQRGDDSRQLKEIVARVQAIYAVIGDSVINRHLDETRADLKELKKQAAIDSKTVEELVDTDKERQDASVFAQQLNRYLQVFETRLIPLIEDGADKNMVQIQQVDGQLDEIRDEVLAPLGRIDISLLGETKEADESFDRLAEQLESITLIVVFTALLLSALIAFVISRSIVQPLKEMVTIAGRLSQGDMTVDVVVKGKDETAQVSSALQTMVEKLKSVVGEISSASMSLQSASEEVSATAQNLSQGSTEQAASVEETSASMEQMNATVLQNGENSKTTEAISRSAADKARQSGEAVQRTVGAMSEIADKIVLIEDIAYKTNLLALNAAIEAARAGEHGKGFAVVADEVRKLAERSQTSAQEINELAGDSVKVASQAGQLVEELVPEIEKTATLVQEISAASDEQVSGIQQVKNAVEQLDKLSQNNAASSEELASTSEEMSAQSTQLLQTVGFFIIEAAPQPD